MVKNIKKISILILFLVSSFSFVSLVSPANAALCQRMPGPIPVGGSASYATAECRCINSNIDCDAPCDEPNSQACAYAKLGIKDINTSGILVKRNPTDFISTVLRFLLAIVVIVVVFRIVMAGIAVANAKEDGEKRKEGFQKMINACIGLVIAFSAFGIAELVTQAVGGEITDGDLIELNCDDLRNKGYDESIITRCKEVQALGN